jgi:hypothetical protein
MNNLDVRPCPGQALGHETPVAALRCGLAAEQAIDAFREHGPIEGVGNTPRIQQRLESRDIPFPVMVLAIVIANLGRRRQLREMDVPRAVKAIQEPGKVVLFREPGELPTGFEADIDHLLNAVLSKESEEALG